MRKWPPSGLLQMGNSAVIRGPFIRKWVVSEPQETGNWKNQAFAISLKNIVINPYPANVENMVSS
jgi:hypothetical protein